MVTDSGQNWGMTAAQTEADSSREVSQFNGQWLRKNMLAKMPSPEEAQKSSGEVMPEMNAPPMFSADLDVAARSKKGAKPRTEEPQQPSATQVAHGGFKKDLSGPQLRLAKEEARQQARLRGGRDLVERYKERLEQEVAQPAQEYQDKDKLSDLARRPAPSATELSFGDRRPDTRIAGFSLLSSEGRRGGQPAMPPPNAAPAAATGLASLDFKLPERGVLYLFTAPRGEAKITAQAVSDGLLRRLIEMALAGVIALAAWFAIRLARSGILARLATPIGSTALICLGLLSFCGGVLPVVGLVAVVAGCGLKVRRRMSKAKQP